MGIYVVSGCPRSGTSLMMDCLRVALGDDRLLGKKFPQLERLLKQRERRERESDEEFEMRTYMNQFLLEPKIAEAERTRDLNPNGFFEDGRFTVTGLAYNINTANLIKRIKESEKPFFGKIVSQGLNDTDPELIEKVVFMLRDPYSVAKSQERLKRQGIYKLEDGRVIDIFKDMTIHTPEMFINVTLEAASWIERHPDIPIHVVNYDELIEKPLETLKKVEEFLGEGDFETASKNINPKLRRSNDQKEDHSLWEDAEIVYTWFKDGKYKELLQIFSDKTRAIHVKNRQWLCPRAMVPVSDDHCKTCKVSSEFRKSFIVHADKAGIPWKERPCAYDVAYRQDKKFVSIDESINSNHFLED